jgi:hypothetical protein
VGVLKWTRESGGDMALAAPQQQVRRVLSVTGLIDVFSVYPSVEQAASGTRPLGPSPDARCRDARAAVPAITPARRAGRVEGLSEVCPVRIELRSASRSGRLPLPGLARWALSSDVRPPALRQRFEARKGRYSFRCGAQRRLVGAAARAADGRLTRLGGAPRHDAAAAGRTGDLNPAGLGLG